MTNQRQDAASVARKIRAFLDGNGGDWDWDDFTSCSLRDERLDCIRRQAGAVELPLVGMGRTLLERLAEEAEQMAQE